MGRIAGLATETSEMNDTAIIIAKEIEAFITVTVVSAIAVVAVCRGTFGGLSKDETFGARWRKGIPSHRRAQQIPQLDFDK